MEDTKVFDVDQHLCDLHICEWDKELPIHLQHNAPRNMDVDGVERLVIEGKSFPKASGLGVGSPIGSRAGGNVSIQKRMSWMKQVGVDYAILTPGNLGMAIHAIEDPELKQAVCERYWDWQLGQVTEAGTHCTAGLLVDPFAIPSKELLTDSRVSCLYMRPTVAQNLHMWDEEIIRLFQTAVEYDLPVLLHGGTGYYQNSPVSDQYDNYYYSHLFSHLIEMQMALAELIGHGIFEQVPGLKISLVEAGVSWVPPFVARMQHHLKRLGKHVPGKNQDVYETLAQNCIFSVFNEDGHGLGRLLDENPWMKTALGSDFPHWDTMSISGILKDVHGERRQEVAYKNAQQFFTRANLVQLV